MTNDEIKQIWEKLLFSDVVYLPIVGPVFSKKNDFGVMINDLLTSDGDCFLPYDKNSRWFKKPTEKIVKESITMCDDALFVPVHGVTQPLRLKAFFYCEQPITEDSIKKMRGIALETAKGVGADCVDLVFGVSSRVSVPVVAQSIFLQELVAEQKINRDSRIVSSRSLEVEEKESFRFFSNGLVDDGFGFLFEYLEENPQNEALCFIDDGAVRGVIGPIDIAQDAHNNICLLPPYFGVDACFRGKGIGSVLWSAAMQSAARQGASYVLVQNAPGTSAAQFYEFSGLKRYDYYQV